MDIFAITENREKRKVTAVWKGVNGKPVKLEEDTPEYFSAVRAGMMQGVLTYGA